MDLSRCPAPCLPQVPVVQMGSAKEEMTPNEINEMVALKLGWRYHEDLKPICWQSPHGGSYLRDFPDYCHSIAAAWEIVENLAKKDLTIDISFTDYLGFKARVSIRSENGGAWTFHARGIKADTAPLAICLAFLKLEK